jgi:hypothetical protein
MLLGAGIGLSSMPDISSLVKLLQLFGSGGYRIQALFIMTAFGYLFALPCLHFFVFNKRVKNLTLHIIISEVVSIITFTIMIAKRTYGLVTNSGYLITILSTLAYYLAMVVINYLKDEGKMHSKLAIIILTIAQLTTIFSTFFTNTLVVFKSFVQFDRSAMIVANYMLNIVISVLLVVILENLIQFIVALEKNNYELIIKKANELFNNSIVYISLLVISNLAINVLSVFFSIVNPFNSLFKSNFPLKAILAVVVLNVLIKFIINAKKIKDENDLVV